MDAMPTGGGSPMPGGGGFPPSPSAIGGPPGGGITPNPALMLASLLRKGKGKHKKGGKAKAKKK